MKLILSITLLFLLLPSSIKSFRRRDLMERCPLVKPMRSLQLNEMLGFWYVVQYYSSSEDNPEYKCLRANLEITDTKEITMNFTYFFLNDPNNELMMGNITWFIPNFSDLSHWIHSEQSFEGVYNTFIIDSYQDWALIMHCAEKKRSPRYLSALMLSRSPSLANNVKIFLREKLPQYNVDLDHFFDVRQDDCIEGIATMNDYYKYVLQKKDDESFATKANTDAATDQDVDIANLL
ncbi:hypothetical protein PVAND_013982 [Polypedilum vanderplanki]|uniref:Apolipoprotein D n=1 Tax=Polypedilum vanderplanki TaxID=319348 RepID=A0A9J6CRD3_POLVA|nr:hypothetical protein PVAND_013982 [Polypedilum vanderplanki]